MNIMSLMFGFGPRAFAKANESAPSDAFLWGVCAHRNVDTRDEQDVNGTRSRCGSGTRLLGGSKRKGRFHTSFSLPSYSFGNPIRPSEVRPGRKKNNLINRRWSQTAER